MRYVSAALQGAMWAMPMMRHVDREIETDSSGWDTILQMIQFRTFNDFFCTELESRVIFSVT